MSTMRISELVVELARYHRKHGDLSVALWDLDTGWYFTLTPENIEAQRMEDGSLRLSIGPNCYGDSTEAHPANRLVKETTA